jgi:hypothetical protein
VYEDDGIRVAVALPRSAAYDFREYQVHGAARSKERKT